MNYIIGETKEGQEKIIKSGTNVTYQQFENYCNNPKDTSFKSILFRTERVTSKGTVYINRDRRFK